MNQQQRSKAPLVEYLEDIAAREDRATLAALRASLDGDHSLAGLRVVLPFLPQDAGQRAEDDAVLLAGLFALRPVTTSLSLAKGLRMVWRPPGRDSRDSVEKRFLALMAAERTDLAVHLRRAISLLAASDLGIDWDDLYRAIRYWDYESDFVRRRWARDFWALKGEDASIARTETATT